MGFCKKCGKGPYKGEGYCADCNGTSWNAQMNQLVSELKGSVVAPINSCCTEMFCAIGEGCFDAIWSRLSLPGKITFVAIISTIWLSGIVFFIIGVTNCDGGKLYNCDFFNNDKRMNSELVPHNSTSCYPLPEYISWSCNCLNTDDWNDLRSCLTLASYKEKSFRPSFDNCTFEIYGSIYGEDCNPLIYPPSYSKSLSVDCLQLKIIPTTCDIGLNIPFATANIFKIVGAIVFFLPLLLLIGGCCYNICTGRNK